MRMEFGILLRFFDSIRLIFRRITRLAFGWFVFISDDHPKRSVWGLSMGWVSRGAGVEWDFNGGKRDKIWVAQLFS